MDEAEARRLREALSLARIEEYERACGGDLVAALRLHCWNTEVSEAFHGPLEYLELALRNAVDRAMSEIFGRDDWWISRHVRNPGRNKAIQRRMTDSGDELELVIVAAMWLTGFDCPPLHTLYLDKPMRGAA